MVMCYACDVSGSETPKQVGNFHCVHSQEKIVPLGKQKRENQMMSTLRQLFTVSAILRLIEQRQEQGCKVLLGALLLHFAKVTYTPHLVVKLFTTITTLGQKVHQLLRENSII